MSETLTSQELKSLGEFPGALEMGELRKITTLQDIPLAEGISRQESKPPQAEAQEEHERKLKTTSLKRFLRLPAKKKFGDGSFAVEGSEIDFQKVNMPEPLQSPKRLTGSSKATLKSSLSTYWNSVFKSKKTRKSPQSMHDGLEASSSFNMENLASTVLEQNQNVLDEIQSLKISQECPPK